MRGHMYKIIKHVLFYMFVIQLFNGDGVYARMSVDHVKDWVPDEMECPELDAKSLPMRNVPIGAPWRAYKTLPESLLIRSHASSNLGQGVFAQTFVSGYTWLGLYEGEIVRRQHQISPYTWHVLRGNFVYYYLDGRDERTSSWLRYVSCSRTKEEENVIMVQCYDNIYHMTSKDILPGQELLINCGLNYVSKPITSVNCSQTSDDKDPVNPVI